MPEILIILVVALLLFGPKKLPELGRGLGQSIREFRKGAQSIRDELEQVTQLQPSQPATGVKVEEPKV